MEEDTIALDTALSMLADRINELEQRLEGIANNPSIDLPSGILEQYSQSRIVGYYVGLGIPVKAALEIVGISTDQLDLSYEAVNNNEVFTNYSESMRSLQTSLEALKSIFEYASEDDYTQKDIHTDETEETPETNTEQKEDSREGTQSPQTDNTE
jgi:hypothetical protein